MENVEKIREFLEANKQKSPFKDRKLVEVKILSGGLINYVYRLKFDDSSSAIAKYYPPHFAHNKNIQFSQNRYHVEKTILTLLNEQPWTRDNPNSLVRTPKVLFTDDTHFLIIMQDAGENIKMLQDYIKNDENLIKDEVLLSRIAKDIHDFCHYLSYKSGITWETHKDVFQNQSALALMTDGFFIQAEQTSKELGLETELDSYLKKIKSCFNPFENPENAREKGLERVLSYGDLWTNQILFDPDTKYLWIIDSEMVRFDTPTRDIQEFMAFIWVMRQSEKIFNSSTIDILMRRLQFEFFGDESKDWRLNSDCNAKATFVLWVTAVVNLSPWEMEDKRGIILKAINAVEKELN